MKKIKSEKQYLKELERLKYKPPRAGVKASKIIPDKTKYTRKVKHGGQKRRNYLKSI